MCNVGQELMELLGNSALSGRPVTSFLRNLCTCCPSITEMRFHTYLPTPGLSERLKTWKTIDPEWLAAAQRTASDTGATLWDALAQSVMKQGKRLPRDVFVEALAHRHSEFERTFVLTRQEVSDGGIDSIGKRLRREEGLALCSEVRVLAGYAAHIPMLDFACATTTANQTAISTMLGVIGQTGVIVNSGNSYHFLGASLLTSDEWVRFMGQALLLAPFIDVRFIGHRLFDGECRLRVLGRNKLRQRTPLVETCIC